MAGAAGHGRHVKLLRHYSFSLAATALCAVLAWMWAGPTGLYVIAILAVLELSLSFDNAVVNATVLKDMSALWQKLFLTVGILIAVFGMRLVFPLAIVAVASGLGMEEVVRMALDEPDEYSRHLTENHVTVAAFGGTFLLLVFLGFLFDEGRDLHWLGRIEARLARLGKLESAAVAVAILALLGGQYLLPQEHRLPAVVAGLVGVVLFMLVDGLDKVFADPETTVGAPNVAKRSGVMGFLYLEVLDASFSFDGVIGAFAISKDVVIIMLGLAIGAVFVRSMTVHLVRAGTLQRYVFLEHGAHYAIGFLAFAMLASAFVHVPELVTGLVGVVLIALSVLSSIGFNRRHGRG